MTEIDLLGRTLGPFQILSELGRGGMAVVYKAHQIDLERTVALKVLPPELSIDKNYQARFLQEARSAAALEHPHIVPIYAIGTIEGVSYISMKYIAGKTLKTVVEEHGALDIQQTVIMLAQVADALDYAHRQGVIHRDIKPSNMMTESNGWVYLTDFGLARTDSANGGLTMAGTVMGTPEYMSPEQAQGLTTIGPPTDIYALGVVLYEMLTGRMPFQADTPMGMLVARLQYSPRPPRDYRGDLPEPVEDVIMRALARRPEARYPTAKAMIDALKQAAGLSQHSIIQPQRPVSPASGVPTVLDVPASQRNSPPIGMASTPLANPSQTPTRPGSEPALAPTQAVSTPTPRPNPSANLEPTFSLPRTATPPATPIAGFGNVGATTNAAPRSRTGIWIAAVVALVVIVALVVGGVFLLRRPDPRIASGLEEGRAAIAQKGGFDHAIATYKQVIELDENNVEAHTQLAFIYNLRDHYQDAETEARKALDIDTQSSFALTTLADSLSNQNEYNEALDTVNKAIAFDDQLSYAYGVRSGIKANRAVENSDQSLLQEATDDANKALELAAKENDNLFLALAHSARGYVYWQAYSLTNDSSNVDNGVEEFNQAIGLQNQIALFHSNLGYFYNAQGKYDLAKQRFEAALDADDQYGHSHAGLGWNLYYLRDYQGALSEFDQAIKLEPRDIDAYIGKSYVYQYQDTPDYDQAIDVLKTAAEIAPNQPNIFSSLGWALRSKAVNLEYKSPNQKAGYNDAEEQFRAALKLNDKYVDALTGLGWILQDQGDVLQDTSKFQEGVETLQKSLQIKEDQPYAHDALGWCYYSLSNYDDALKAFQRASTLKDDYADPYYGMGRVYAEQGDTDKARTAYQTAVDHGSSLAQDALDQLK